MKSLRFLLLIFTASSGFVLAQDCGTLGENCVDDKQCCGGCCIENFCTQTYDNCQLVTYPCMEEYCPPGFECYMFQPSRFCQGCGLQKACKPFKDPGPGKF
ncbi:uncharacterized protein LOC108733982 [Agrilus planipennis]|uniref:Uncharacterized protein LOC108733982 n=1 Tax=Agrilus planipennis TaxID=224129 RepID=A0A1W4WK70_AGRPL|nr:uncharacterized protein LOC108733982 [Agrilus planipennis]